MAAVLDGPRLSPRSGAARQLVVFLHGYGADGNDLIELGRVWQPLLPQAAFVSPHAPEPCDGAPMGRQWFALTFRDPNERWVGVNKAAPVLERFIDAELARHGLPPSALALVGFSQGTMMALHVGLAPRRAAGGDRRLFGTLGAAAGRQSGQASPPRSDRGHRCCWCTATRTISYRRRRCSRRRRALPRSACRRNGTCPPASVTASTRKGSAMAANFWREALPPTPDGSLGC